MYKLRLKKIQKIKFLIITFFTLVVNCAYCLSTDSGQDIEIQADTAEMDDVKKITIYRGDVVVIQGSIKMTGHTMHVYFDKNNDMELVVMDGTPATYRQLPDDSTVYDEAEALKMEYYALKNYVILIDQAKITQEETELTGERIEYDTVLNKVKAKGRSSTTKKEKGKEKTKKERVKIIIKKKNNSDN